MSRAKRKEQSATRIIKTGIFLKSILILYAMLFTLCAMLFTLCAMRYALCDETDNGTLSPKDMILRAWDAWGAKDYEKTFYYTNKCIELYSEEAKKEQASLKDLPPTDIIEQYEALNAVGTSYFIQGEAYVSEGKIDHAKEVFNIAINDYGFSQSWDPRGWFWSIKEKSQISMDKIENKEIKSTEEQPKKTPHLSTKITLYDAGKEDVINYRKYGVFRGAGTDKYKYVIKDQEGLAQAAGEGIYPNTSGINWDPQYRKVKDEARLEANHWDFVNSDDLEASFYKWAQAPEPTGVRMFYTGLSLEKSALLKHAIKSYYAIVVHFPKSIGWTYFHTPWYIAQVSLDRIDYLLRHHPELSMELEGARIKINNGFDNDIVNDVFIVNPGELKKVSFFRNIQRTLFKDKPVNMGKVIRQLGDGKVDLVKYENGHWQLRVEGRPYFIKGVVYSPSKIGQSPDERTLDDWMKADYNHNGKIDSPYDTWVDKNFNNKQDAGEPIVGDFQLLKEMGANTIRLYHHASNKELLRDLYNRYGIMVIMGDLLGAYTVGSGAKWYEGTDYRNPDQRNNMMNSVREMVEEFKDEPYVLFWMLGNETNYGVANNAGKYPEDYYKFVNEAAKMIKSIDRDHPVAVCNGDLLFLDIFSRCSPDVDIYGANAYRGKYGFGKSFWENIKDVCDRPTMITEYGCPAFMEDRPREFSEQMQDEYLEGNLKDIEYNSAGHRGIGNSIGGMLFEWSDEWWKAYEPSVHDVKKNWSGPFPDGWNYEEWLGITSQGDGSHSPFMRQLRKAYFTYQELWR